jgi:hypothetical protein
LVSKTFPLWSKVSNFIDYFLEKVTKSIPNTSRTFAEDLALLNQAMPFKMLTNVAKLALSKVTEDSPIVKEAVTAIISSLNLTEIQTNRGVMNARTVEFTVDEMDFKLQYYNECFFRFAQQSSSKFHLILADIPYIVTKGTYHFDTLEFVGDAIREGGFTTTQEYLICFVEAYLKVSAEDSFGFVYCGFSQQLPLCEMFEEKQISATPCYVNRKIMQQQMVRANTSAPLNCIENALFLKRGNPQWANYGMIKLIQGWMNWGKRELLFQISFSQSGLLLMQIILLTNRLPFGGKLF